MVVLVKYRRFALSLLIFWALFFLGHSWEQGLKMDAMENASIAKHILSTGDWKHFRYDLTSYKNYYNHPPLVIWIEALFFKFLGASDTVARLVPALFALGTLVGVVVWGSLCGTIELGLLAGWVLLTSNRYIKFASDALLEGPLCFFLVWGVVFFLKSLKAKTNTKLTIFSLCLGLSLAGAFLTKSVFFVVLPASIFGGLLFCKVSSWRVYLKIFVVSMFMFLFVLIIWFLFGDGYNFLVNHYAAISYRVENRNFATLTAPILNIITTYWPWLPLLFYGLYRLFRCGEKKELGLWIAAVFVVVVLAGFSLSGHFFEHYLTIFYPASSILVGLSVCRLVRGKFEKLERFIWGTAIICSVIFATIPIQLRRNRAEPLATTLNEMNAVCKGQSEILVTQVAMDRWLATAIVLWKTPFEIKSLDSLQVEPQPGQLLIVAKNEQPSLEQWERVPLCLSQFNLYQSKRYPHCR